METQDVKILVALIALCSAIIGALITAFSNYFVSKKLESEKRVKEKQKEVYLIFLRSLQDFKNSSDLNSLFPVFQDAVNQVCLYGDNKTSLYVKAYFEALVHSNQTNVSLNESDHNKHDTKIMNAMRKSLGLNSFESFSLIKFTPNQH